MPLVCEKGDQAVIKTTGFKTAAIVNARNQNLDRAFWAQAGEWVPVVYTGIDKHNLNRQIRSEVVNRERSEERRLMTEFKRRNRAINPELHANYGGYTTASQ